MARIEASATLRARVEMLAALDRGPRPASTGHCSARSISTTRAREVARQTARLAAGRARDWVEQMILPVAEQLGTVGLKNRIERLIAQADAAAYRRILDDAAAEPDTVKVTQQGYGRAAITYRGSLSNIADLHAALLHRVRAATCPATGTDPSACFGRARATARARARVGAPVRAGVMESGVVGRWGSGNGRRPRWRRS